MNKQTVAIGATEKQVNAVLNITSRIESLAEVGMDAMDDDPAIVGLLETIRDQAVAIADTLRETRMIAALGAHRKASGS